MTDLPLGTVLMKPFMHILVWKRMVIIYVFIQSKVYEVTDE